MVWRTFLFQILMHGEGMMGGVMGGWSSAGGVEELRFGRAHFIFLDSNAWRGDDGGGDDGMMRGC